MQTPTPYEVLQVARSLRKDTSEPGKRLTDFVPEAIELLYFAGRAIDGVYASVPPVQVPQGTPPDL